jgi:hypothetical protein
MLNGNKDHGRLSQLQALSGGHTICRPGGGENIFQPISINQGGLDIRFTECRVSGVIARCTHAPHGRAALMQLA